MYLLVDTLKCKRSNTFLPSQIVFDVQLWNDDVATAASNALLRKRGAEVSPDDIQLIPISKMLLRLKSNYASMNGHRVSTDNDMITLSNYRRDDQQFSLNIDSDDTCEMAAAYFHSDPERLKKMVTIEVQLSFVHATSRTITVNQKHVTNGTLYRILHNMNPTDGLRWLSASDLTLFAQKITIDVMSTEVVEPYYYISESEQLIMEKNIEQSISQAENSRSVSVNWDLVYWPTDRVRPDRALDYLKFMFHYDENVDLFTMNPGDPSNQVEDLEEYNKMRCAIKVTLNKVFQLRKSYINDAEGIDADTFSTDTLTPEFVPPTDSSIHIITTIQPRLPSSQRYNLTKKNINYVLNQSEMGADVTALNELKAETVTNSNQLPVQLNTVRDRPTVLLIAHDNKILKKGVSPPTPIEEILAMGTRYNIYDVTFDCKQERIFWSAYNGSHE
uniref:Uncharacterized protein n=1 Tax=Plectus sambesii TaxID=2011161 RepID=A0A914UTJ6_9BILA